MLIVIAWPCFVLYSNPYEKKRGEKRKDSDWHYCFVFWSLFINCKNKNFQDSITDITGLGISFQTLEMSCLWWTDSSQIITFEKIPNRKVSSQHYLTILVKSSKHGLSYSLKYDPGLISKITLCANLSVSPIDIEF